MPWRVPVTAPTPPKSLEFAAAPWSHTRRDARRPPAIPPRFNPAGSLKIMARRVSAPYLEEPVSGLATWARNLAIFAVVAIVVSILIVRFGFLEMKPALATFFGALAIAAVCTLVGLAGFAAIWQNGWRGMGR